MRQIRAMNCASDVLKEVPTLSRNELHFAFHAVFSLLSVQCIAENRRRILLLLVFSNSLQEDVGTRFIASAVPLPYMPAITTSILPLFKLYRSSLDGYCTS